MVNSEKDCERIRKKMADYLEIGLKELQEIELNLFLKFVDVCKKNNLRYYIDGGTLLGAMCYEGFIPWDDDIDLKMPRSDYEILMSKENQFPDYIRLDAPTQSHCEYLMLKLIDNRTVLYEDDGSIKKCTGVYLDIFPMDGIPEDPEIREKHLRLLKKYNSLFHGSLYKFKNMRNSKSIWMRIKGEVYSIVYSPWKLYKKLTSIAKRYDYDTASKVGLLIEGDAEKEQFEKNWLIPGFTLDFEGYQVSAPSGYREHLAKFYGTHVLNPEYYHNLPVIKTNHNHRAYWKDKTCDKGRI